MQQAFVLKGAQGFEDKERISIRFVKKTFLEQRGGSRQTETAADQLTRGWFAETQANRLGRVTLATGAIDDTPPITTPNSLPEDVVINSAGYPWVTEAQGNKIAIFKVSTISGFVQYTVPTPGSEPYGIALAADGETVWFTERAGNKLARFNRAVSEFPVEFPLPTPNSSPTGIALDGAGCAWYTASAADRLGRLCPSAMGATYLPLVLR